jgi:transcription-repair coupling factor (superfamily II helicase)
MDHGVARLDGLETMEMEGFDGEAVRLEYAEGQRLLVPAAESGKLWRYGADEGEVALDNLKGGGWERRRAKVTEGLAETARALIQAAAEREAREAPKLVPERAPYERLVARFPFEETPDQARAITDVLTDLASGRPMNRLVIGDVGFGKTEVAIRAAAAAAFAGRQVVVLAPTTVLARQHVRSFQRRFDGLGIEVAHLSRLVTGAEATRVKEGLKDGRVRVVVGTQALLGKGVEFADLCLAVIDEEQRLGHADKEKVRGLLGDAHLLTMTATPIPRTLQSALVGLQDLSVIATPPARRRPIRTLLTERDSAALKQALLRERRRGGQSFVVVPRVEDVKPVAEELRRLLPRFSLRVAHGQLPAKDIDEVMVAFAEGDGDVLLATSIIESGLDVPRANTMVVLRPDLLGLAQLHQLRGRVGRGGAQAYCYLMTEPGAELPSATLKRLGTLQALDRLGAGMAISAQDLDLRGGGELFGERQSGHVRLIGLALYQDLLAAAIRAAKGEPAEAREVEFQVDAAGGLPRDYIPEAEVRLNLYHRLARTRDAGDVERMEEEIADRFGPAPPKVRTLLRAAQVRALARALGVLRISAGPEAVALDFEDPSGAEERHAEAVASAGFEWVKGRLVARRASETAEERLGLVLEMLEELA